MSGESAIERARLAYEDAVFRGDAHGLAAATAALDRLEADLALARGRLLHARHLGDHSEDDRELALFERAAEVYRDLGDARGEGEALFWVGTFHQVVRGDQAAARPAFGRALELATSVDDRLTLSYVVRHLGFAELHEGRLDAARDHLEESVRLRRELGFSPGVAAGHLAVAELEVAEGRLDEAKALLAEARSVAEESGADGVLRWIDEARDELGL